MEEEAGLWRWMQVLGERGRFSVFFFYLKKKCRETVFLTFLSCSEAAFHVDQKFRAQS